jgi:transposase-like protein
MEALKDPASSRGALKGIADQLGVHPQALRTWVRQAEIDGGVRPGTTTDDAARIAELEREVRELRRALLTELPRVVAHVNGPLVGTVQCRDPRRRIVRS